FAHPSQNIPIGQRRPDRTDRALRGCVGARAHRPSRHRPNLPTELSRLQSGHVFIPHPALQVVLSEKPRFFSCAKNGPGGTICSGAKTPAPLISPAEIIRATMAGGEPVLMSDPRAHLRWPAEWQSRMSVTFFFRLVPFTIVR